MPTVATLTEITQNGGTYAFAVWRLVDGTPIVTYHTQAEHDAFIASGGMGVPPNRPALDAVFMLAAGGLPIYNTPTGRPRIGDFFVANTQTRETWFFFNDTPDWSYGYGIATAPAGGFSRLQGRHYAVANGRLIRTLTNPQVNALRGGTFSYSQTGLSIVNNVATIEDDFILRVNSVTDEQIPNHRSVTFDAFSYGANGFANGITVAHTVANETNRYILSNHGCRQQSSSSLTCGGTGMSGVGSAVTQTDTYAKMYGLAAPSTGSVNVVGVSSAAPGADNQILYSASFYGVAQSGSVSASTEAQGNSSAPSASLATATNEMLYSVTTWEFNTQTNTVDTNWTKGTAASQASGNFLSSWGAYRTGSGTLSRTDSLSAAADWIVHIANLAAADTGPSLRGVPRPGFFG